MKAFLILARSEFALLVREPAALFFSLLLPLLILVLNGGGNEPQEQLGGRGAIDAMVPGLVLFVLCTSGLMVLPETLAGYRERGFLRRLRISPLRPWQILSAHAITHLAVGATGLVLLVGVGAAAFDLSAPGSTVAVALSITASGAAVVSIGFLVGARLPTVRTTQAVAAVVYFPSIFVSGAVMPSELLPEFAQQIGRALPFAYGVRAIRASWDTGTVDPVDLGVLVVTAVVATTIAIRTFRWEGRY